MDIINASKTPKYKLFKWLLLGLGSLVFIIGIVLNIVGANVTPTSMSFDIGTRITKSTDDNIWRTTVWTPETTLIVNTEPANQTNTPITFEVIRNSDGSSGTNHIKPISPVRSGRPAKIVLHAQDGEPYTFNEYVTLTVTCGGITEILEIKILPPSERIGVEVTMREGDIQIPYKNGAFEISEQTYADHLPNVQGSGVSHYHINVGLFIYNAKINDIEFREECEEENTGVTLEDRNRYNMEGITLLGGTRGVLIDHEFLQPGEYHFRISCTYLGEEHFELITIRIID